MYDDKSLQIIEYHRTILIDEVRTDSFLRAILKTVKPGDVVLDLGCGTGILSYFACMAGARHVFAVEQGPIIELAKLICKQNGYQDRVAFINEWSEKVELQKPVDVIISETIGNLGFEEGILGSIIDARHRFLTSDGQIIPQSIDLLLVPVENPEYEEYLDIWCDGLYTLDFSPGRSLVVNNLLWADLSIDMFLSQPVSVVNVDLDAINSTDFSCQHSFVIKHDGILHGLGGWFKAQLAPGVRVSNAPPNKTPSWDQVFFPIEQPLPVKKGDLLHVEIEALNNAAVWQWKISAEGSVKGEVFSPQRIKYVHNSLKGLLNKPES